MTTTDSPARVEYDVRFRCGETMLAGTLITPAGGGPHPAVVMMHGAGPADRHGGGYFPPLREHFARHGIAVLCYDKPGVGGSAGDWQRQRVVLDRAAEAVAAARYLQGRPDINARQIGLWGIGEGGWAVPLAAVWSAAVAFIVVVSACGLSPAEQIVYEGEQRMRADGWPAAHIDRALASVHAMMDTAAGDGPLELAADASARVQHGPWSVYFSMPSPEVISFRRYDLHHDPLRTLMRVTCPVLAIFGERDRVVPVRQSMAIFRQALTSAGNRDVTFQVFPQADHGIRLPEPGGLAPGYLEAMTTWMRQRAAAVTSADRVNAYHGRPGKDWTGWNASSTWSWC